MITKKIIPIDINIYIKSLYLLMKPRVMSLVIFTCAVGLLTSNSNINTIDAVIGIVLVALGAGGAGCLNMWYESDLDALMARTCLRPIPTGKINRKQALTFGITLSVISVGALNYFANFLSASLLLFTIFFYLFIYTIWLKRKTPQNIVIGGAAGAFPPMVGWVAATGSISIEAIGMFMLIFMWTPPHFWALALFMNEDYTKAGVPMLTVTHGKRSTRKHILIYTIFLTPFCIGLAFTSIGGPLYFILSILLSIMFLMGAIKLFRRAESAAVADKYFEERKVFRFSLFYLFLLFSALLIEAGLRTLNFNLAAWPQVF